MIDYGTGLELDGWQIGSMLGTGGWIEQQENHGLDCGGVDLILLSVLVLGERVHLDHCIAILVADLSFTILSLGLVKLLEAVEYTGEWFWQ